MSSDTTELTFVRCPSCRSLVPAVSLRCRMCGTSLENSSVNQEEQTGERKGRVRQRTMSLMSEQSETAIAGGTGEDVQTENVIEEEQPAISSQQTTKEDEILIETVSAEDPLGAYIEEIEIPEEVAFGVEHTETVTQSNESAEKVVPANPPSKGKVSELYEQPLQSNSTSQSIVVEREDKPARVPSPFPGRERPDRGNQERNNRERDNRERDNREGERHKQSWAEQKRATTVAHDSRAGQSSGTVRAPERPERFQGESRGERQNRAQPNQQPGFQAKGGKPREERREIAREGFKDSRSTTSQQLVEAHSTAEQGKSPENAQRGTARLVGWFVSYAQGDGTATELREGKFFVTGRSLKESDLVLNDPSVSTPHAMVIVSAQAGVQVQDLMSDRGIFVRESGSVTYRREEEHAKLQHGDWVRFGDVEFMVALVPYVGEI